MPERGRTSTIRTEIPSRGTTRSIGGQVTRKAKYGRPPAGSKTEARGKQAAVHVSGEISQLCQVIREVGTMTSTAEFKVTFRQLFSSYERISNKLVGILLRARRQDCVRFDGEILFQGRDDDVVITLLPELSSPG